MTAKPCECAAYDEEHNPHTVDEHTHCGVVYGHPHTACGGCDTCLALQVNYHRGEPGRVQRIDVGGRSAG